MNCGRQGAIISYVTRSVNLSHYYTAIKKCQKLMNLGLMESSSEKRDHIYIITEKGLRFFHEMQKFIAIAQEVKIRY
jgi:predicted transcriptional regulator